MDCLKNYVVLAVLLVIALLCYSYYRQQEDFGVYRRRYRRPYRRIHPYYYYNYNRPWYWYDYLAPWSWYYYWRKPYDYSQVSPVLA
jgi:hypothetical protein